MQTFEEALGVVCVIKKHAEMTPDAHQKAIEYVAEREQRFRPIIEDIGRNTSLPVILGTMLAASCCQDHALLNVFLFGLKVGMEMERSETGGVKFD